MLSLALASLALSSSRVALEASVPAHSPATSSWVRDAKPDPNHRFNLTVALKVEDANLAALEKLFWEVSDPKHPRYAQYKSNEQLAELLAVPAKRISAVSAFFRAKGAAVTVSPTRDSLNVQMPVWAAESALQTEMYWFAHDKTRILRASKGYSLPTDVAAEVTMVGELVQFPRPRVNLPGMTSETVEEVQSSADWPTDCGSKCSVMGSKLVTPAVLAARYKLNTSSTAYNSAAATNAMAVAEFQGQYYEPTDLSKFSSACGVKVEVTTDVGKNKDTAGIESELDIEYIKSVAPEVPLTVVYNAEFSLLNWCNQVIALDNSPPVHSVSYGNDEKQQTSKEYMVTTNTAFQKAGAKGLSILFASGDQGVCGREGCGIFSKVFHPDFPAGSPYVTAVGGTDFATKNVIGDEKAWAMGGGGFSNEFAIPSYQTTAVAAYKASADADLPPQKMWNNTGRGYPDVAALGGQQNSYCVATHGTFTGVAGTSAACPVFAGVIAKLNGLRLAAGKPALGFLNPFLYQNPTAFNDVTQGTNNDGRSYGFKAIKGWDAATGLGTPNFEALVKAVAQLK